VRRRSSSLLLVGALVLAVAAGFAAVQVVKGFSETVPAIVAVRDIPPFTRLDPSMLKVEEVPVAGLPEDVFKLPGDTKPATDTRQLAGQYTAVHVLKGDVIRISHLVQVKGDRSLMSARLSALGRKDLRAFALPFDPQSAVGGEIRDGDRVDIVASVRIDTPSGAVGVGKVIARNVLVLKAVKGSEGNGTLVLALTPSEIEDVAFALSSGKLMFALNPYETDEQAAVTPGVTGRAWLEKYGFPVPVQPGR